MAETLTTDGVYGGFRQKSNRNSVTPLKTPEIVAALGLQRFFGAANLWVWYG